MKMYCVFGMVFLLLLTSLHAETAAERLMHATHKIFNSGSTCTGFLVQDSRTGAGSTNVVLVSAKHAFDKAKGDHILLVCRVKDEQGTWQRYDHKVMIRNGTNTLWTSHATQDVAVLRCTMPPQAHFETVKVSELADATAVTNQLFVGSRFLYFAYPHRVEGGKEGFPILREGLLSGYPFFPIARYPKILISAPTFSGDSGAPALLEQADKQALLVIGIVITRTQQTDKLSSAEFELTFKRDMALGSLLHAAYIRETLDLLK